MAEGGCIPDDEYGGGEGERPEHGFQARGEKPTWEFLSADGSVADVALCEIQRKYCKYNDDRWDASRLKRF
jgi:hypothetical protein